MDDSFGFGRGRWHEGRHGWFGHMQARRGDIKAIILSALLEKPMHGYEVMSYLEDKSDGMWRPSPGSVYPTLQLLEDEDLVMANEKDGKKIYSITEKGKQEAKETPAKAPWDDEDRKTMHQLKVRLLKTAKETKPAVKEIVQSGDQKQIDAAFKVIEEAAAKIRDIAKNK